MRLSFGRGNFVVPDGVRVTVERQLAAAERRAGLEPGPAEASNRFGELVLHERTGQQAVVLVDEYDKPVALGDRELARANRDFLRSLYGAIKDCDEHLRFVFLTGVSKFSQAGLFPGLNNLRDITLEPEFSDICGYTDAELDAVFAPELEGLDRDEIRRWYNGYNWRGADKVYNPFDILLLFKTREFKAHWFQSGTPTFLVDLLSRHQVETPALERMVADDDLLSTFDVDDISTEALLFQTGYLTIVGEEATDSGGLYRLPELRGEAQPEQEAVARHGAGNGTGCDAAGGAGQADGGGRSGESEGAVRGVLRERSSRLAPEERPRALRGLLGGPRLLALRGGGSGRTGRGSDRPRTPGHGCAKSGMRASVRVQGRGRGTGRPGACADAGARLRGQVPASGGAG